MPRDHFSDALGYMIAREFGMRGQFGEMPGMIPLAKSSSTSSFHSGKTFRDDTHYFPTRFELARRKAL